MGKVVICGNELSNPFFWYPPDLRFVLDAETIGRGLNFTLETSLGDLDLIGKIAGGGSYESLLTATLELFSYRCRVVTLEKLIELKPAAGRPRDSR